MVFRIHLTNFFFVRLIIDLLRKCWSFFVKHSAVVVQEGFPGNASAALVFVIADAFSVQPYLAFAALEFQYRLKVSD